ncbi:set10 [Symbiodinium microadriaticum]|nr:set10 [Symbiodinium microadriaticum]
MNQAAVSSLAVEEFDGRPPTLEDRFSTSLSLPHAGELAYHDLSGANAVVLHSHGHTYTCVPPYADHLSLRSAALSAVAADLQVLSRGQLCFARLLPPLDRLPAIQFVAAYCSDLDEMGVVDLRPSGGGVHVVQVPADSTPAERIANAVQRYGEPDPASPLQASLAQGHLHVMHREHVVDPFAPLRGTVPTPIVVTRRHSHLAAGYREPGPIPDDGSPLADRDAISSDFSKGFGGSRLVSATLICSCLLLGLLPHRGLPLPVVLAWTLVGAVQLPESSNFRSGPPTRSWITVSQTPSLASVAEHATLHRSLAFLDSRTVLGFASTADDGLPVYQFCVWSPGERMCFLLAGTASPVSYKERLLEAKAILGRGACVPWEPQPLDRCIHLISTSTDPSVVSIIVDTGREFICLEVSSRQPGPAILAALRALCPADQHFRLADSSRQPVRNGDVIRAFSDRAVVPTPPQFQVPFHTLPPFVEDDRQALYVASVDMGLIKLTVPRGLSTWALERALTTWLGRQRCLGVRLHKLSFESALPVYCLPRRGRSTLVVVLIDLVDTLMDPVVHVVDDELHAELDCELLRDPWRPHSAFWDEVISRGPVCVGCWTASLAGPNQGPPVRHVTLGLDICRSLGDGWQLPLASQVPHYDLVAGAARQGIRWDLGRSPMPTREVAVQTAASHWPTSPLFSGAMPVPRRAEGCSFHERFGSEGTLFHLECPHMRVRCTIPCVEGRHIWALRIGNWVYAACTTQLGWDEVLEVASLSYWDLPGTSIHGSDPVLECLLADAGPSRGGAGQHDTNYGRPIAHLYNGASAQVLEAQLQAAGHVPTRHSLFVAFDSLGTVVELVSVPPGGSRWWIVRDGLSRELLRPVTTWVEEDRRAVVTLNPHGQVASLAATPEAASLYHLPQGARGATATPLTRLYGVMSQGVLTIVDSGIGVIGAAAALSTRWGALVGVVLQFGVTSAMLHEQMVIPRAQAAWSSGTPLPRQTCVWSHTLPVPVVVPYADPPDPEGMVSAVASTGHGIRLHATCLVDSSNQLSGAMRLPVVWSLLSLWPPAAFAMESTGGDADGPSEPSSPDLTDLQAPTPTATVDTGADEEEGALQRPADSPFARTSAPLRGDLDPLLPEFAHASVPQVQRCVAACLSDVDVSTLPQPFIPHGCPFTVHNPFTRRSQCKIMSEVVQTPQAFRAMVSDFAARRGWQPLIAVHPQPTADSVHLIPAAADPALASVVLRTGHDLHPLCATRESPGQPFRRIVLNGRHGRIREPYSIGRGAGSSLSLRDGDCLNVDTGPFGPPPPTPARSDGYRVSLSSWVSLLVGGQTLGGRHLGLPLLCLLAHAVQLLPPAPDGTPIPRYSVGHFPWREPLERQDLRLVCRDRLCRVSLLCPWRGPQGIFQTGRLTGLDTIWQHYAEEGYILQVLSAVWWLSLTADFELSLFRPRSYRNVYFRQYSISLAGTLPVSEFPLAFLPELTCLPPPAISYGTATFLTVCLLGVTGAATSFAAPLNLRFSAPTVVGVKLGPFPPLLSRRNFTRLSTDDAGTWAAGFLPIGGESLGHHTTVLPLPPHPFATMVVHSAETSRAVILPAYTTLRKVAEYVVELVAVPGALLVPPPALRRVEGYMDETVRLRHGDTFEVALGPEHPRVRRREALYVPDLVWLPHLNAWHVPLILGKGGWVTVWSTTASGASCWERVWIPGGSTWSPRWLMFSHHGRAVSTSRWVPTPFLESHDVTFVAQGGIDEAHVLFVQPYDPSATYCKKLVLVPGVDRGPANLVPSGWQWRPDIEARIVHGWPRNGDILVPRLIGRLFQSGVLAVSVTRRLRAWLPWAVVLLAGFTSADAALTSRPAIPEVHSVAPEGSGTQVWTEFVVTGFRRLALGWWVGQPRRAAFCLAPALCAGMFAPPLEQQHLPPVPVGKYPWRLRPSDRVCHESVLPHTPARLLSPFLGTSEEVAVSPESHIDDVRISLSGDEPFWYREIAPIWPALWQQTLVFVPAPSGEDLVCVVVVSPEWQLSVLLPRRADVEWVLAYLRRMTPGLITSVRPPIATQVPGQSDRDAVDWRTGDVLLAFQRGDAAVSYEPPVFISPVQVRHAAVWSFDFDVQCELPLLICRVGRKPSGTTMPPPARWVAADGSFTGRFRVKYPYDPAYRNVLLERCEGSSLSFECVTVAASASRYSIAQELPPLRDGDILHYDVTPALSPARTDTAVSPPVLDAQCCRCPLAPMGAANWGRRVMRSTLAILNCYLPAIGAPTWEKADEGWHLDMTHVMRLQAALHKTWWARSLRDGLPTTFPRAYHAAWGSFPLWHGGVPESVFVATDGSGLQGGSWAFLAWGYARGQWYRIGWDSMSMIATPWLGPRYSDIPAMHHSYSSELVALQAAAVCLTGQLDMWQMYMGSQPVSVTIPVDNAAALQVAAGSGSASSFVAVATRVLWQAVQSRLTTHFRHIHSHVGILASTLVDALAGLRLACPCAVQDDGTLGAPLCHVLEELGPFLWLVNRARVQDGRPGVFLPSPPASSRPGLDMASSSSRQSEPLGSPDEAKDIPPAPAKPPPPRPLSLVTANVQSMKDAPSSIFNPSGHAARRHYTFSSKFPQSHVMCCASRRRVAKLADGLLAGGYPGGRGTSKDSMDAKCGSDPRYFSLLLALMLPLTVCSAHAPHADRPDAEAASFWQDLRLALLRAPSSRGIVVGLDANADFFAQDESGDLVGTGLASGDPGRNDMYLLELCLQLGFSAPATQAAVQAGPGWSWEHTSGVRKRIDHLLFQMGPWEVSSTSQAHDLDLGHSVRDHMPLRASAILRGPAALARKPRSRRWTASELLQCGSDIWGKVRDRLSFLATPDQCVDVLLQEYSARLAQCPPRPPLQPKQPYLSPSTVQALRDLRDWRQQLRNVNRAHHACCLLVCFKSWRHVAATPLDLAARRDSCRLCAVMLSQERRLSRRVHDQARRDKQQHFLRLTQAATEQWHSEGRATEAITKLRWASRKAAERRAVHAAGGYDIDAQLEEQFRAQEGARLATNDQVQREYAEWIGQPTSPCPNAVPTLLQMEHLCRRQQAGKAPGPDLVRNELWRSYPAYAGQWFWQVCSQVALSGREPLRFKLALICALYKKGPAALPQNYRSIALMNGMAKVWHSHLRSSLGTSVLAGYDTFQLGGRKGIPVGFAGAAYRLRTMKLAGLLSLMVTRLANLCQVAARLRGLLALALRFRVNMGTGKTEAILEVAWMSGRVLPAAYATLATSLAVSARPLLGAVVGLTSPEHAAMLARVRLVIQLTGPLNASPAQRVAAAQGRECTQEELQRELFLATGGTDVYLWPDSPPTATSRVAGSPVLGSQALPAEVMPRPGTSPSSGPGRWFSLVDQSEVANLDWRTPSPLWSGLLAGDFVCQFPGSWHRYWKLWHAMHFQDAWSFQAFRDAALLRRISVAAPGNSHDACQPPSGMLDFLAATVVFRTVCQALLSRGTAWLVGARALLPDAVSLSAGVSAGEKGWEWGFALSLLDWASDARVPAEVTSLPGVPLMCSSFRSRC